MNDQERRSSTRQITGSYVQRKVMHMIRFGIGADVHHGAAMPTWRKQELKMHDERANRRIASEIRWKAEAAREARELAAELAA